MNSPLLVDSNERPYVLRALADVGFNYQIRSLNSNGFGDFFWSSDETIYSVEHKTVSGLVPNFYGRPTRQLSRQFDAGYVNILIIEGVCDADSRGKCRVYKYHGRQASYSAHKSYNVSFSAWSAWKSKLMVSGYHIIESPNSIAMAQALKALYDSTSGNSPQPMVSRSRGIKEASWQENLLCQIPNIGPKRAVSLLERYGTIANIIRCEGRNWPLRSPKWKDFQDKLSSFVRV